MSQELPEHGYLEALGRELRGGSVEEAQTRALDRLGPVEAVASEVSNARRRAVASARERAVHRIAYLGAALVLACSLLAHVTARDGDGHLGLEVTVAAIAAGALLLVDGWRGASERIGLVLAGVAAVWIAAVAVLASQGELAFCGQVLGGFFGAAGITHIARRVRWRTRRGEI